MFEKNVSTTMSEWLQVYYAADVEPSTEAIRKTAQQYYFDKIDVCKEAVSILDISVTQVLNNSWEKNKKLELYAPGGICHICRDKQEELRNCNCNGALKCGGRRM